MLKTLLKKQMMEIFRSYFYDAKKNRKRSKLSTALYIVLYVLIMAGLLGGIFTYLAFSICGPFTAVGMDWMYFALFALLSVFLGAFGSVFNTYSQLYLAKDNDLLLSLPVPVPTVIASRLLGVYLMGLMYSAVVIVPAVIVYWIAGKLTLASVAGGLLLTALISVVVLILSCVLGWVVAKISLKLKNKSFITVLSSLIFLGAYYFFYFKAQTVIQDLILHVAEYGERLEHARALYILGQAGAGDWAAMGILTLVVAAAGVLTWRLLSGSFLKIATASASGAKAQYSRKAVRARTPDAALLGRELRRFTASPNYMLNCGLGILFLLAGGIALLIKGGALMQTLLAVFSDDTGTISVLLAAAVCMITSMNDMATPSVSLEGKSLWLIQSLPVEPWRALRAKLRMQLLLSGIPTLFCAICAAAVCAQNAAQGVLLLAVSALYALFSALLGLTLGVKMPNLTWTSEIAPIKQSGSVMIALFGGWAYALALGGLYLLFAARVMSAELYLLIFAAVTAVASALLYSWLKTRGARTFAAL